MNKYKSRNDVPEKYKWDLTDFYKNDEEYDKELNDVKVKIDELKSYVGCTKDSDKLFEFISKDRDVSTILENLVVYAYLKNDEQLGVSESIDRVNKSQNLYSDYFTNTNFFVPELISLSEDEYKSLFENDKLLEHKHWLDEIYDNKKHSLTEKEQSIIDQLLIAAEHNEELSSNLINNENDYGSVLIDGVDTVITSTNARKLLQNRDEEVRKTVFHNMFSELAKHGATSATLLDSYVKTNNTCAKIHNFNNAWESKLYYNHMPNEAYNTLINTVESNVSSLHKYYRMFKDTLGFKELHQYDLNLNITSLDKEYSIEDGIELIKESLKPLGEDYQKHLNKIFDKRYIDYCEYKGKRGGGYSISTVDHDSRILLSYNYDLDSVSTVIHECGHNVHGQYVFENNRPQYVFVSTLVSEVASLTNECLLSSYLAKNGKTKDEKLAGISNMLRVFDSNLFDAVREGKMEQDFYNHSLSGNAITKDYMNEIDLASKKKYFGSEVVIDEFGQYSWTRRHHYFNNYYLFDYSFCISVASANAARILSGDKEALERYIKFLSLGSDVYPIDAFKVLGFNLCDSKVYEDAIKYFDSLVNEFIKISKE